MAPSYAALEKLSDNDIIRQHDEIARSTSVGLNFYRDELSRRAFQRATEAAMHAADAALEEARESRKLAKANMWVAIVAVVVAVAAPLVQLLVTT